MSAVSNNAKVFLAWYLSNLATSPLRTKACTSGILSGLQELTAQKLSGAKKFDKRIIQMAAYGKDNSSINRDYFFNEQNRIIYFWTS